MKTIMTALVALVLNYSASANHLHTETCKVNCPEDSKITAPASKSFDQKLNEVKLKAEDKVSYLHFKQTMQTTLNLIAVEKHQQAIEDLKGMNAYNKLMANTLDKTEVEKLTDVLEDITAEHRFEQLLSNMLLDTAKL